MDLATFQIRSIDETRMEIYDSIGFGEFGYHRVGNWNYEILIKSKFYKTKTARIFSLFLFGYLVID